MTTTQKRDMKSFEASATVWELLELVKRAGGNQTEIINKALEAGLPDLVEKIVRDQAANIESYNTVLATVRKQLGKGPRARRKKVQ